MTAGTTLVPPAVYRRDKAISFAGLQVSLSGQPADGDSFAVAPSSNQSLFSTVQNLIAAMHQRRLRHFESTQLDNAISALGDDLDQALSHISTVQAAVGGRLNPITTQQSVATSQQTQLQAVDFVAAEPGLRQRDHHAGLQNTTLSAALQTYAQTQGLSLFKYI